jgi:hypothetical protein
MDQRLCLWVLCTVSIFTIRKLRYSEDHAVNFVCDECKGYDHDGQPLRCPGDTWCDCLHRPVTKTDRNEEPND